jgi:hypothetical protein
MGIVLKRLVVLVLESTWPPPPPQRCYETADGGVGTGKRESVGWVLSAETRGVQIPNSVLKLDRKIPN